MTIWSDVPGIFTADPRIVRTARVIPRLSFSAANALAHCGAKILFPHTLHPAQRQNIYVFVRSSLEPAQMGTLISSDISCPKGPSALVLAGDKLSFIGKELDALPIELPQIEQGTHHRTFKISADPSEQGHTLIHWHEHLFSADKMGSKTSHAGP